MYGELDIRPRWLRSIQSLYSFLDCGDIFRKVAHGERLELTINRYGGAFETTTERTNNLLEARWITVFELKDTPLKTLFFDIIWRLCDGRLCAGCRSLGRLTDSSCKFLYWSSTRSRCRFGRSKRWCRELLRGGSQHRPGSRRRHGSGLLDRGRWR